MPSHKTPLHTTTPSRPPGEGMSPRAVLLFVVSVLLILAATATLGLDNDQLTAVAAATVAIVGAGAAATKVSP